MSENSPELCRLLQQLFTDTFAKEKVRFIAEEGGTGKAFSALPFDHLVFTGSSTTGKAVMANAAKNLVPVTLELGGKSPAIIADDYDIKKALERILGGKTYNSGQTCVAPDYLYVPEDLLPEVINKAKKIIAKRFVDTNHQDYTSIIDSQSFKRLVTTLEDAKAKGADIYNLIPNSSPDLHSRKFPLHLVTGVDDTMQVMQREIFGPILPIIGYQSIEQVISLINKGDRPLALYLFSNSKDLQQKVIQQTRSGGVTINDVMLHVAQDDLPFGGSGHSGIGHYHGKEGFERLSKMRPVMYQASLSSMKLLYSPYSSLGKRMINFIINRKFGKYD
ncbi:NAD-dependent aldehyde dehydrogenase [Photobacterium angustum S14]|uniref:NAD-dependent aldehyde dehydrogenase n=1 Tax=Photobacterium angustum (strain S14 / CCUG 15956) TaxID=314292 RepID=Q1ZW48_PHOAS|nr:aldehyde dehydrogenase family protein [Photobacterium angustum]EAS65862.1 NAD-dependent aldehyde dehydrogenase [Photobacterium angustum S14]